MSENLEKYLDISPTADVAKLQKFKSIKEMGIDPYPRVFERDLVSSQLKEKYSGLEIGEKREDDLCAVAGRLMLRRDMGKVFFLDIYDETGKIQIYVSAPELSELEAKLLDKLDIGDFIGIFGFVFRTKTGEITVHCKKLTLLAKSLAAMPEKFHGLSDTDLRYRQRFIDMTMNPGVREIFKKRAFIIREIRNFLDEKGFVEFETPILQTIYGGASAEPFKTHHNDLDIDVFLRISPELYLKKLIAGGFEKVYDIAKDFRNEGMDHTHSPEFTMIEWYEAYTDYFYQMKQMENLVESIVKKMNNGGTVLKYGDYEIDYKTPWRRLTIYDGLRQYANIEPTTISKDELISELQRLTKNVEVRKSKGELLCELFEETAERHLIQPTFVCDHPVEISPLTKIHRREEGLVERFEVFVGTMELANCYTELNDPIDQALRLKQQEENREFDSEAQPMDKSFVHAVEFGMPPMSGIGIGLDRLTMALTNTPNIRDVIAFPIMKPRPGDL
ncbi:MAG: lysine--tRNA ligase [Rickettsiales bacterium]|jgi:lysyl-tRNA synthetase class 2|nr:lysine--tRNA ligase [Rickettsiales bacterium]